MSISRMKKVPLRELWQHEALDFTKWLANNLDFLIDTLGFDLSLIESEAAAGPFSADILAEDGEGNFVIIENQLEKTDHDHLGKLLTYLSNLDAKTAIWITSDPRPEHEKAINWLNETLPIDTAFFLLKIEAYKIDESNPAPLVSIVAGPSTEGKQAGIQKKELAERHVLRLNFWEQLLAKASKKTSLHANISPSKENWVSAGSGRSGIHYSYLVRMKDAELELEMNSSDKELNKKNYDKLFEKKDSIEIQFGESLIWDRMEDNISSCVRYYITSYGLKDESHWSELQDEMIEAMIRLERAFKLEIQKL